jgi:micrococcal nuclease
VCALLSRGLYPATSAGLNCPHIPYRNFGVRWDVAIPDPHGFDGNRNGVGCET